MTPATEGTDRASLEAEIRRETLEEVRDLFTRLSGPNSWAVERMNMLLKEERGH